MPALRQDAREYALSDACAKHNHIVLTVHACLFASSISTSLSATRALKSLKEDVGEADDGPIF